MVDKGLIDPNNLKVCDYAKAIIVPLVKDTAIISGARFGEKFTPPTHLADSCRFTMAAIGISLL